MMVDFDADYLTPEKKKPKWAIGCAVGGVILLCFFIFVAIGGFSWLSQRSSSKSESLTIGVNTPSDTVHVGENFTIEVVLSNSGDRNIAIKEISLPRILIENALLINAEPVVNLSESVESQTQFVYDMVIAPNGRETIVFHFQAVNPGNIRDQVKVKTIVNSHSKDMQMVIAAGEIEVIVQPTTTTSVVIGDVIPFRSVVQIIALTKLDGVLIEGWMGSGTVISEDGLILTNAHVVLSDRFYDVADLIVSITTEQDRPPVRMFFADVLQGDRNLDLAVIKIRSDLQGNPANFAALGIEPVKIGLAETLQLGDPIIILGYPGIGGETITLTRGEVSGFTFEEPYGNRAFIKTSAVIAGGNSGGLAANSLGEIIGVPTQVGSGDWEGQVVDCRPLADTNRDGVIDEYDNCVPTGGFINAMRPINLAQPLIDAAMAGQVAIVDEPVYEYQDYESEGEIVLFDSFEDNRNNWYLGDLSEGWVDILEDQLVINVQEENTYIYTTLPDVYSDLIVVVDYNVLKASGVGDFGLICGYVDNQNYHILEISEDGYYSVWSLVDDAYIAVVDWTSSSYIPTSGVNTLAAYCGYDGFALAVNETLLLDVDSDLYQPGHVGLMAGTYAQPDIMVGFSNFAIMQP